MKMNEHYSWFRAHRKSEKLPGFKSGLAGFGFFTCWQINHRGLFNSQAILEKYQYNLNHSWGDKLISPKVNTIARLEFELANYDVTVQHVSHCTRDQK